MNRILSSCGLSSCPRWIELDNFQHKYFRKMCSACGEIINKRVAPRVCPHCGAKMEGVGDESSGKKTSAYI